MRDSEADDERSSFEDDDMLFLMDGIALNSTMRECNDSNHSQVETVRRRKINNAERNLMNKNTNINIKDNFWKLSDTILRPLDRWKMAVNKISYLKDPWKNFDIKGITVERVERYNFDATNDSWLKPVECFVKMEEKSFNRGAMRECFRLKKMSSLFKQECNWTHAGNYVAKRYIESVDNNIYYEDVKLQMDAKLWGQEYSRQPGLIKKVDICQMSVIRFVDRPGQPLYHLEHFIEGEYIKYNSNSGFVDENTRNTPQAFSHFTFERSGHNLIVVDIQGVGDLYTDPQIHTFTKTGYGDGNLGPRGMALFFYSHSCNFICKMLGLKEFDLLQSEKMAANLGLLNFINIGTVAQEGAKVVSLFMEQNSGELDRSLIHRIKQNSVDDNSHEYGQSTDSGSMSIRVDDGDDEASENVEFIGYNNVRASKLSKKKLVHSDVIGNEGFFRATMERKPSCAFVIDDVESSMKVGECILGEIHHEMARLHNCGKFIDNTNKDVNWEAFMFHEELAAKLGCLEAIINLACFFLGIMSDSFFENYPIKARDEDRRKGVQYMNMAANAGDRRSMIYLGNYLSKPGPEQNLGEAYFWYDRAVVSVSMLDDSGCFDSTNDTPIYEILARMAEILTEGGSNIDKNPNKAYELYTGAAEDATGAGKGRLAAKYYELADSLL